MMALSHQTDRALEQDIELAKLVKSNNNDTSNDNDLHIILL
jgi:hypothetical protein